MSVSRWLALGVASSLALGAGAARAQGRVEINQARALAGGVTAGDTPGFPVTISEPGSYVLVGNLQPTDLNPGIQVAVPGGIAHVTIDLGGFSIAGPVVCTNSGNPGDSTTCSGDAGQGVFAANQEDVTVKNGTISGMHGGVQSTGRAARVENVRFSSNLFQAIFLGSNATVDNCSVHVNGSNGISLTDGGTVRNSTVRFVQGTGIVVGSGSSLIGNVVAGNNVGIFANDGSLLIGNTAYDNASFGFQLSTRSGYTNSTLYSNNGNTNNQVNPEVSGGTELGTGTNFCGTDKVCP